jgi:glucuronokinase
MFWRERPTVGTSRVYARAALVGNPSDGYGGRTLAFTFRDLHADVTVVQSPRLVIDAGRSERVLLNAAFSRFASYCFDTGANPRPCSLSVRSSIPSEVGLAGSSATVIAALRALSDFNQVTIPRVDLPTVALAVEEDLDIPAGLQDRVTQVYQGLVYMDFEPRLLADDGHGVYERLDPSVLANAYVAWCPRMSVNSSGFHRELRRRFLAGDPVTAGALAQMAELTKEARAAIDGGDRATLSAIVDANFALRRRLGPLEPHHLRMVEVARAAGASANYAGSGGAITGFVDGNDAFAELTCAMAAFGCTVIRPTVALDDRAALPRMATAP